MSKIKTRFAFSVLCGCIALLISGCGGMQSAKTNPAASIPPAAPLASDAATNESALLFLENKVKSDPEDFSANNKLAGLYLQKLRETGDVRYLDLTFRAAAPRSRPCRKSETRADSPRSPERNSPRTILPMSATTPRV